MQNGFCVMFYLKLHNKLFEEIKKCYETLKIVVEWVGLRKKLYWFLTKHFSIIIKVVNRKSFDFEKIWNYPFKLKRLQKSYTLQKLHNYAHYANFKYRPLSKNVYLSQFVRLLEDEQQCSQCLYFVFCKSLLFWLSWVRWHFLAIYAPDLSRPNHAQ